MPTFKMEMPTTSNKSPEARLTNLENTLEELIKRLEWLTARQDSKNVKRLDTNETVIKSADGTTEIVGPVLVQKDNGGTTRLQQGYDAVSGAFVYELYDALGVKTVGIDSGGAATFTGTITGGTIQTAASGSSRIVITGNTLKTYYHDGVSEALMGIAWGIGVGPQYGDVYFYDDGTETFRIQNDLAGSGWRLKPMNGGFLYIGDAGTTTYPAGTWNFTNATITNLITDTVIGHSHTDSLGGATSSNGSHAHTVESS